MFSFTMEWKHPSLDSIPLTVSDLVFFPSFLLPSWSHPPICLAEELPLYVHYILLFIFYEFISTEFKYDPNCYPPIPISSPAITPF